ncbi:hypothetical protein S7711_11634, partial [Stachybotrys chartarum IBT 7711]
ETD